MSLWNLQVSLIALTALNVPIWFGAVALGLVDPALAGNAAAAVTLFGLVGLNMSPLLPLRSREGVSRAERLEGVTIMWMWVSGVTHLTWELGWCLVHPYLHDVGPNDLWSWTWWVYGVADHRYLISDPFIVILEWCTVVLGGTFNFYVLWLMKTRQTRRAYVWAIVVSMMELYGTVLYFGSEVFNGMAQVDTHDPINLWVKFVGMNSVWMQAARALLGSEAHPRPGLNLGATAAAAAGVVDEP